jgi:restriction system protein
MKSQDDGSRMDWLPVDSATPALIEHWRQRSHHTISAATGYYSLEGQPPRIGHYPDILLQAAVVVLGPPVSDGQIVEAVAVPWDEIIRQLAQDPEFLFKVPWRKLEEIIAGAYHRAGWPNVILTPRSGDRGRDVIATKPGILSVRIVDQIKAYKQGHVVTADEVRAMLGVLQVDHNVSKGLVTTTSAFAPRIAEDSGLSAFMPHRLELRNGNDLRHWLLSLPRGNDHS